MYSALMVSSSDVVLYSDRQRTCGMSCGYTAQQGELSDSLPEYERNCDVNVGTAA